MFMWLCKWSICDRLLAESALCHLLDIAAFTWCLLFICLELELSNKITWSYNPHRTFSFPLYLPRDRNQLVQHNYFYSVLHYFCSRYPHRHQLCVDSCVRQLSLFGLILSSASDLGLPKHHCRERSHLSQIFLFCVALLSTNFPLKVRLRQH